MRRLTRAARAFPPLKNRSGNVRGSGPRMSDLMEGVMKRIIQANIQRFKLMLDAETDAAKRAMLCRLLTEQEMELKQSDEALIRRLLGCGFRLIDTVL